MNRRTTKELPSLSRTSVLGPALALFLLGACASPVPGLWPPAEGEPSFRVQVSVDTWHSVIAIWPADDPAGADPGRMREWSYADRRYYLEGKTGCSGSCGAVLWPTDATVQVSEDPVPFYRRTPQPPARHWTFWLSSRGHRRLRVFLAAEKESKDVVSNLARSRWFVAKHDYYAFHHCHHWTARALREAGLPVWSFYSIFKWSFEAQLDRALSFVKAE